MDRPIDSLLHDISPLNRRPAQTFWEELQSHIPDAMGATKSHHAWKGGYRHHIQEVMNLARILYERLDSERPLPFPLASAYLVLFLHDCEKPFRHASDQQLKAFPWVDKRPTKSDKAFQKKLIDHYDFTVSDDEWNALRYVEGEPESEYIEGNRLQRPLAAFCHVCDTISARIWYDYPAH